MQPIMRNHMKMKLYAMSKLGFVLTFVIFSTVFVASVLVGFFFGPPVFVSSVGQTSNLALNWTGSITQLTKLHQQLILVMQIHKEAFKSVEIKEKVQFSLSVDGGEGDSSNIVWYPITTDVRHTQDINCDQGKIMCDSVVIAHEPFIAWSAYRYHVSVLQVDGPAGFFITNTTFTFSYVNDAFTLFELWCRFVFLVFSFIVFAIFITKLRHYHWRDWSVEQKWTSILLFGTLAYNDPFSPLPILVSGWFPVFLDVAMLAFFLVLLMFFWLVMFDGIRQEDTKHSFKSFYLPKLIVLGLFWTSLIVGFTLYALYELDDPSTVVEVQGYVIFFQVAILIVLLSYSFWLGYLVCRACGMMSSMPFLSVRLKFFGLFTLLIFVMTAGGILFGAFTPLQENAAVFVTFLSLLNLYVYTLAFVYLPSGGLTQEELAQRIGVTTLEEEDEFPITNIQTGYKVDNDLDETLAKLEVDD